MKTRLSRVVRKTSGEKSQTVPCSGRIVLGRRAKNSSQHPIPRGEIPTKWSARLSRLLAFGTPCSLVRVGLAR